MMDLDFIYENLDKLIEQESQVSSKACIEVFSAVDCSLIDKDGKQYLDLTSNKQSQPLGYSFKAKQEDSYIADSDLFKTNTASKLRDKIAELTKLENVYFTSSQKECYDYLEKIIDSHVKNTGKDQVLTSCSFESRNNFSSIKNIDFIPVNKDNVIKTVFTKNTAAVIVEVMQISETINIAEQEYLKYLKEICSKNNVLLIFDLSNLSPYRMGSIFNYDTEISPDVLIIAKGLGNGIPLGAVAVSNNIDVDIKQNETTINLAYDNAYKLISNELDFDINEQVQKVSEKFAHKLELISEKHVSIGNIQSKGALITFNADFNCFEFANKCLENGVIIDAISIQEILLTPQYILKSEDINKAISVFEDIIKEMNLFDTID